jgi:hypothetical protein
VSQEHDAKHLGDELFQDAGRDQGGDDVTQAEEAPEQDHRPDQYQRPVRDVQGRVHGREPAEEVPLFRSGIGHP